MSYLKFNQAELVNLEYSLKREVFASNKAGAYCNTSIISCNTRQYHGLLVCPIPELDSENYVLLSALDEALTLRGKQFSLGTHCYGDIYEPKGYRYIVGFDADGIPTLTYKVGHTVLTKALLMDPAKNAVLIRYRLESAPEKETLSLRPFLAFRKVHSLTCENSQASTEYSPVTNGAAFCMYPGFPGLYIQTNVKNTYKHEPYWYKGITYSDEYRRGFDCREDLLVPGTFNIEMKPGDEVIVSASLEQARTTTLKSYFKTLSGKISNIGSHKDILLRNADRLKVVSDGKLSIMAGFSWLKCGLLRETLLSLPGLTLYADGDCAAFEEILDNLIEDQQERLFHKTTQIEAPLLLVDVLQQYIAFGADPAKVWKKYGPVVKKIIDGYQYREEASICPNGLLWCQKYSVALTWMNAYVNGSPVTERGGFQVETNAWWYNALCFSLEMCAKYGKDKKFTERWTPIRDLFVKNFNDTFVANRYGIWSVADYVDNYGQHFECRPNMIAAAYIPYPLLSEEVIGDLMTTVRSELVTRRGIRTLSPRSENYKCLYEGSQTERDLAYHQGSTHTMLLGFVVDLGFRMNGASYAGRAKWLTEGFFEDCNKHGVGAFSEVYDGDPPHEPHGAIVSATATAALLRAVYLMDKYSKEAE